MLIALLHPSFLPVSQNTSVAFSTKQQEKGFKASETLVVVV